MLKQNKSAKTIRDAKKAARRAKFATGIDKFMGAEPRPEEIRTPSDIQKARNWYNYTFAAKDFSGFVIEYMKLNGYSKTDIADVRRAPDWACTPNAGALSRMLCNGVTTIPPESISWLKNKIRDIIAIGVSRRTPEDEQQAKAEPKVIMSVADRVKEKISILIGDIEAEVDNFVNNDYTSGNFKPFDWMKSNEVKANQAARIAEYYVPLRDELKLVLEGKDTQLKEGYSRLNKAQIKRYYEFVESIISNAQLLSQVAKATRKTRKPKEKSATQLISKMKYMKESPTFKVASIDPTKIIKAQMLVIFNTKYRKLGVYVAADDNGLSVKGTAITNYNPEKSTQKTLRKPEEILKGILMNGKLAFNRTYNDLKTSAAPLNGRLNSDTILLKVL